MKLYKVLDDDLSSPFTGTDWSGYVDSGEWATCCNFNADKRRQCADGFYATEIEGLTFSLRPDRRVFEVEVDGRKVEVDKDKRRYEKMRFLREVFEPEIRAEARRFTAYNLEEALYPINPLLLSAPKVGSEQIRLLGEWKGSRNAADNIGASVWDIIRESFWGYVWFRTRNSVWGNVWIRVGGSARESVWGCAWAYAGSLLPAGWPDGYPFEAGVKLWRQGFVLSFDGKVWRLHAGPEADIVYEMEGEDS